MRLLSAYLTLHRITAEEMPAVRTAYEFFVKCKPNRGFIGLNTQNQIPANLNASCFLLEDTKKILGREGQAL